MAFMHGSSVEGMSTELDLWIDKVVQSAQEKSTTQQYNAIANFDTADTLEFDIPGVGYAYPDMAQVYLYTKQKIVNGDGSDITAADQSDATLVNYGFHAMWSQIDLCINGTITSQSSMTYPYRAYIEAKLNYGRDAKETHLQQRLWYEDTPGHFDSLDGAENHGLASRRAITANSKVFEMKGPLHLDMSNVDRLLLNNCNIRLKLTRNRDAFTLMSTRGTEKIKLLDAKLYIRKATISPSVLLAHARALEKAPAKYPVNRVDIKIVTLAQGVRDKAIDNLFPTHLPMRFVVGFVDNRAFNGDCRRNPWNFQHFNVSSIQAQTDGGPIPSQPLTPDYANDLYMDCYDTLFTGTGIHWKDEGNHINWREYARGTALYAFDLSPDLSASSSHWNLQRQGSLRIDVRFAAPLAAPVNAIIYAEFQNLIEIDKDRNIITDFSV